MFRKQHGTEVYFSWSSKTARVVPNRKVHFAITFRDTLAFALLGLASLATTLKDKDVAWLGLIVLAVCLIERSVYLSNLKKVPLEASDAQVDKAYLQEKKVIDGLMAGGFGVFMTFIASWLVFTHDRENGLPLIFGIPLLFCGLAIAYVGFRILAAKFGPSNRAGGRER